MENIPAFPSELDPHTQAWGMSLRDYFAARAMQSLLVGRSITAERAAKAAYEIADFMIKERNSK